MHRISSQHHPSRIPVLEDTFFNRYQLATNASSPKFTEQQGIWNRMVFYLVCNFFRISLCPALLIWPSSLFWHFGKDEEVDLFRLREKQKRKAVLIDTCHISSAQTSGCGCYTQKAIVGGLQGCGRLTAFESADTRLTSFLSWRNVIRDRLIGMCPYGVPHYAVDAVTAYNDVPFLYRPICKNNSDSFVILNNSGYALLRFD